MSYFFRKFSTHLSFYPSFSAELFPCFSSQPLCVIPIALRRHKLLPMHPAMASSNITMNAKVYNQVSSKYSLGTSMLDFMYLEPPPNQIDQNLSSRPRQDLAMGYIMLLHWCCSAQLSHQAKLRNEEFRPCVAQPN